MIFLLVSVVFFFTVSVIVIFLLMTIIVVFTVFLLFRGIWLDLNILSFPSVIVRFYVLLSRISGISADLMGGTE